MFRSVLDLFKNLISYNPTTLAQQRQLKSHSSTSDLKLCYEGQVVGSDEGFAATIRTEAAQRKAPVEVEVVEVK